MNSGTLTNLAVGLVAGLLVVGGMVLLALTLLGGEVAVFLHFPDKIAAWSFAILDSRVPLAIAIVLLSALVLSSLLALHWHHRLKHDDKQKREQPTTG